MSTPPTLSALEVALSAVPDPTRARLVSEYRDLKSAYSSGQYDACGLRAGRFAEVMFRIIQERLTGTTVPFGTQIPNFERECRSLEQIPQAKGPESLRVIIPRALLLLYTLRNKRGIGHVGGDIDANAIDAATAVRIADWCLCELLRVVHNLPLEDAQALLDAITERQLPDVWMVVGKRRVLRPDLNTRSQTLLLLYSESSTAVPSEDLCEWVEYSSLSHYRRDVLRSLRTTSA